MFTKPGWQHLSGVGYLKISEVEVIGDPQIGTSYFSAPVRMSSGHCFYFTSLEKDAAEECYKEYLKFTEAVLDASE